jgi:Asp/Glu/hydantoin racemase
LTIRIWHHSFTVLSDLSAYDAALRAHFRRVSRPDTEIVTHGMRPGTYRTNYPGTDISHVGFQFLHSLQFLEGALEAERLGFDAFALSTLPEPALREIRALVDIPVVGYGDAAMNAASAGGRRFGVLMFISGMADLIVHNALRGGFSKALVDARHVGFQFSDVLAAFDDPSALLEKFRIAARALIEDGAEAIIPGEAPLNVLLASHGVTEVDGVPVTDSLAAWVQQAEALVDRKRAGDERRPEGYFTSLPDRARRDEVLRFYGLGGAKA